MKTKCIHQPNLKNWNYSVVCTVLVRCETLVKGGCYLVARFDQAQSSFCTKVSCFDHICFTACNWSLLKWRKGGQKTGQWKLVTHRGTSKWQFLQIIFSLPRTYLSGSNNKAMSNIGNEAVNMDAKVTKKNEEKGRHRNLIFGMNKS